VSEPRRLEHPAVKPSRVYSSFPKRVNPLPIYSREWIDALEAKIHQHRRGYYAKEFRVLRERCGITPRRKSA
jgi:hypothetical protein